MKEHIGNILSFIALLIAVAASYASTVSKIDVIDSRLYALEKHEHKREAFETETREKLVELALKIESMRTAYKHNPETDPRSATYDKSLSAKSIAPPKKGLGRISLHLASDFDTTIKKIERFSNLDSPEITYLAQKLKAATKEQTAYNIWHWTKYNVRYKSDEIGFEKILKPNEVLAYADEGVDCEDLTILIIAIAKQLNIETEYLLIDYDGGNFDHILPIIGGYPADAVWSHFNEIPAPAGLKKIRRFKI